MRHSSAMTLVYLTATDVGGQDDAGLPSPRAP